MGRSFPSCSLCHSVYRRGPTGTKQVGRVIVLVVAFQMLMSVGTGVGGLVSEPPPRAALDVRAKVVVVKLTFSEIRFAHHQAQSPRKDLSGQVVVTGDMQPPYTTSTGRRRARTPLHSPFVTVSSADKKPSPRLDGRCPRGKVVFGVSRTLPWPLPVPPYRVRENRRVVAARPSPL